MPNISLNLPMASCLLGLLGFGLGLLGFGLGLLGFGLGLLGFGLQATKAAIPAAQQIFKAQTVFEVESFVRQSQNIIGSMFLSDNRIIGTRSGKYILKAQVIFIDQFFGFLKPKRLDSWQNPHVLQRMPATLTGLAVDGSDPDRNFGWRRRCFPDSVFP